MVINEQEEKQTEYIGLMRLMGHSDGEDTEQEPRRIVLARKKGSNLSLDCKLELKIWK
jgi:hypothetical protein